MKPIPKPDAPKPTFGTVMAPVNVSTMIAAADLDHDARLMLSALARALRETAAPGELAFNLAPADHPADLVTELRVGPLTPRGGWRPLTLHAAGGTLEIGLHTRERVLAPLVRDVDPERSVVMKAFAMRCAAATARGLPALTRVAAETGYTLLASPVTWVTVAELPGGAWLRRERELTMRGRCAGSLLAEYVLKQSMGAPVDAGLALSVSGGVSQTHHGDWLTRVALSEEVQLMDPGKIRSIHDPHDLQELWG